MAQPLANLLKTNDVLLADGATGTNFFDMGLVSGDAPELWNIEAPEKVAELHRSFIEAGADIILTNTFGGNQSRLKLHNAQDRVTELNAAAARIARVEADKVDRTILVAGSVGPTGELFVPLGEMTHETAVELFREQMLGLKEGGADILWIETMSAREEIAAAAEAAQSSGLEYIFTASFDTAGRTMMGIPPSELPEIACALHPAPAAVGANCGVGATDLLFSVLDMTEDQKNNLAIVAKANCGVPEISGDQVIYSGTPELMAKYAQLAIDAGARIIGGCCGTSAAHLAAMRKAIDAHTRADRPLPHDVIASTGALVNQISTKEDGSQTASRATRRGGRRRSSSIAH